MATQAAQKRYKITNITIRPPRINPASKQDERTSIERVGYSVSWREDSSPHNVVLGPNQLKIVTGITDGMISLSHDGLIKIEEFGDISEVLQAHAASGRRTQRRGAKKDPVPETVHAVPQSRRQARVAEMGQDVTGKEAKAEHVDAINPTGTPNFLVSAPSEDTRRKMKAHTRG